MSHTALHVALVVPTLLSAAACGGEADLCTPGAACVWAGVGERGFNNADPDAHRLDAKLYFPEDVTFGPDGRAYLADWNNHRIRRVELDDRITSLVGTDYEGDGAPREEDRLPVGNPEGAPGTNVAMNHPTDVEFGPDGKLYIAAWHNNKVRVHDLVTDITVTLAGNGYGFTGDGGPCYDALFNQPKAIVFGPDGTLYTNDQRNVRMRKITPDGIVTTIAGTGAVGNTGDGGLASATTWGFDTGTTPRPSGALAYANNTLYVADSGNNRIRAIDLSTNMVTNIAGDPAGAPGYADGAAADARFDYPLDLEIGPDDRLYVADRYNNAIRAIDLTTGSVETVAGNGLPCASPTAPCVSEEGLPALDTQLHEPYGIAFDAAGNLFIADTHNHRILKVTR